MSSEIYELCSERHHDTGQDEVVVASVHDKHVEGLVAIDTSVPVDVVLKPITSDTSANDEIQKFRVSVRADSTSHLSTLDSVEYKMRTSSIPRSHESMVKDIKEMLADELPSEIDSSEVLVKVESEMNSQLRDEREVSF